MGVGEYVHSKEAGQPRAPANSVPTQRQLRAEQAKVEVPVMKLGTTHGNDVAVPPGFEGPPIPAEYQVRATSENGVHKDPFDTDVEGVDDSTIAGTSVFNFDDGQSHATSTVNENYPETSPKPSLLPRPSRRSRASWYGGLGDQVMKKAGFDSDDAEDTASQLTSSQGDGDKPEQPQPTSWYLSQKHRSADEPLSKRLENFWSATKRASKSSEQPQVEARAAAPVVPEAAPPRKLGHMLASTGPRRIALPHGLSATPRTRFSPPKPSLLDQFDISPTRHGSEPPPQAARTLSMTAFHPVEEPQDGEEDLEPGIDETIRLSSRRESSHSNVFDVTHMTDPGRDDDEDLMQDPFLSQSITKRGRRNTVIHTKKRHLEADYPPQLLYQKSFSELQAEPFDKAPTPPPAKSPSLPTQSSQPPSVSSPDDTVSHFLKLAGEDRQSYLSHLSVDEWEDCGDQLIDRFTHLLTEMRQLRRARRRTAAVFEAEVRRRHEQVEAQDAELSVKLEEMRTGGAEVLRGRGA
ncbi:hypothetical protein N7492_005264 [Penicillium capsulatum]|uniref:Extracellular mutant protein 11 C-terminal domain-containing protein n=1 Tax=Penicillium capsulatum TaxID=69766 RepID=A0A9W9I9G0_9EURO|nr:hypothetical protein N7492_005264 [Penicillium capsulatum]KAJ6135630.1 hypothetical protein N7512_000790 [Penicillium capsulatum]